MGRRLNDLKLDDMNLQLETFEKQEHQFMPHKRLIQYKLPSSGINFEFKTNFMELQLLQGD